jgi:hypothetical protein
VYVDAREDRRLLAKVDLIKTATGRRRVSNPNPAVALNDTRLTDASKIPSKAYLGVDLPGLDIQDDQVPGRGGVTTRGRWEGVRRRHRRQLRGGGQEPVPQAGDRLAGGDGRQRRELARPPAARRRDEVPRNMVDEVLDDGEIRSACL